MLESGDTYRVHKNRYRVAITLADGEVVDGHMFLGNGERLVDVLNDVRRFVPLESLSGSLVVLAKSAIVRVEPVPETAVQRAGFGESDNPYEILGIDQEADEASVHAAYQDLLRAFHPDRVVAAGLGDGMVKLAEDRVRRIRDAYRSLTDEGG